MSKSVLPDSPLPAQPKSSNSSLVIVIVVLAVLCLPAVAGVVLVAAGAFAFWAADVRPAPMQPDIAPMIAPATPDLRPSIDTEVPLPAETVPTNP